MLRFGPRYEFTDLSPDGSLVAFITWSGRRERVGVLDVASGSVQNLAEARHRHLLLEVNLRAVFSPSGDRILYRFGTQLRTVDVSSGEITTVANADPWGTVFWLDDGRIAFLAPDRRLMFAFPGETPADTGFSLPDPPKLDNLPVSFAVSPDGSRVVFTEGCVSRLRHLSSGRERVLGRELSVPADAWSPDGSAFLLQDIPWFKGCRLFSPPHVVDILFDGDGRKIGYVTDYDDSSSHGHGISWSNDGRWLLVTVQPTGTEVGGLQYLYAVSVARERASLVLRKGNASQPFVGPGDRIVFSIFDHPEEQAIDDSGRVMVGHLEQKAG